ncbi:MAG: hypothetical protein HQL58_08410 [Magnetococcales bacterium]|nr:hypothetical protein [Magnetococcales bacterium]
MLLLVLSATLVVGGAAYRFSFNEFKNNRIRIVGQVANMRHQQLVTTLKANQQRLQDFLVNGLTAT